MDKDVPYIVYESALARMERTVKRVAILALVAVFLMFASNGIWLYAWMQYDYGVEETTTVSQDGSGNNVYGNDNEVVDGADDNDHGQENENEE